MPRHILLVHGYSVQQLNAYGRIPSLLVQSGFQIQNVYLSAYVSLDDQVTCGDLALALETQIAQAGITDDMLRDTAVLCHSTGAIVVRRWMLNRLKAGRTLPSHLVTLAGANHGSSLSQVGRTAIARVFRRLVDHAQPGERVLADLDYGSTFLWSLNKEWLECWNAGKLAATHCFAMGGDKHWVDEISSLDVPGWQFLEFGSDSIVRISGANLNYGFVTADVGAGVLQRTSLSKPAAHLVIHGYTHGGILGGIQTNTEPPFQALQEALSVTNQSGYDGVRLAWQTATETWGANNPKEVNSTIIFRLRDEVGGPINDSWILLRDQHGNASGATSSLCSQQPIQNEVEHSVVSFYVDHTFQNLHPHSVEIDARSDSPNIAYQPVKYQLMPTDELLVKPNEFTYVEVTIPRDVAKTYVILPYAPGLPVDKTFPPFSWGPLPTPTPAQDPGTDTIPGPGNV